MDHAAHTAALARRIVADPDDESAWAAQRPNLVLIH
jgi:hypothetical protein